MKPNIMLEKQHLFFKRYFLDTDLPTWTDVLEDLDLNFSDGSMIKTMKNFGFVTHQGRRMAQVDAICNSIQQHRPQARPPSAHVYISLLSSSETFGRHCDRSDVVFVQALGRTHYTVEQNGEFEYVLEPGDMLYIPNGVYHTPKPLGPRVGLSLGFDDAKENVWT